MNGSNGLFESDARPNRLCSECLQKLQWRLGFDIKSRYTRLNAYFATHKLLNDQKLNEIDLEALE